MSTYNRTIFFDHVRASLFGGSMNAEQVDGMETMLDYIDYLVWHPVDSGTQFFMWWNAYLFATTYHETAKTMQPIQEYGSESYLRSKSYYPYYGRGLVQLTHDYNYERSDTEIAAKNLISQETLDKHGGTIDQLHHMDQALDMEVACSNLFNGTHQGWYGGKLWTYLTNDKKDYVGARYCVNVQDDAQLIAGHAELFEDALVAAWEPAVMPEPEPEPPADTVTLTLARSTAEDLARALEAALR